VARVKPPCSLADTAALRTDANRSTDINAEAGSFTCFVMVNKKSE